MKVLAVERFGKAPDGGPAVVEIVLENPGWAVRPGQFVMVRPAAWGLDLLWARPFSVYRASGRAVHLLVAVVGRGTARLAELAPGDSVTMWGPLGSFFAREEQPTLLLGGGIGVAPFRAYAESHPRPDLLRLVFGHTLPLSAYPWPDLAGGAAAEELHEQGREDLARFIALLETRIGELPAEGLVLACGPLPMLKTVKDLAARAGVRCQLSLENRMACGVGACLGCVCKTAAGDLAQVCSRGPVFWAQDLDLGGEVRP
ncbi:MAG: dihydroorotate dehydrogenase electron transfer subunit [Thermodesulfobacteriota bacterium]